MKKWIIAAMVALMLVIAPMTVTAQEAVCEPAKVAGQLVQSWETKPEVVESWAEGFTQMGFKFESLKITYTIKEVIPIQPPFIGVIVDMVIIGTGKNAEGLTVRIKQTRLMGIAVDPSTCQIVDVQMFDGTNPEIMDQPV